VIRKLLAGPFIVLAAIVILLEDWLWDDLARLAAAIGRLPLLRSLEAFIARLPPYAALLFFATPALLLVPLKLIALYLMAHGQPVLGVLTIVAAKFAGTALVARIFTLTQPQLLRIPWFAWLYARLLAFKKHIYSIIKATALYQAAHQLRLRARASLRSWLGKRRSIWRKRWRATLRLTRRKQPLA
jgi:hypothetical protein